ncbi:LOB domain-containing protein 24 [Linum grandiflorum]
MSSNRRRCAGCKYLRRRCPPDCVLAPHFPPDNPQRFESVHKIFGASNLTRLLQEVPVESRRKAADCMTFEASARVRDPVYGCVGMIHELQQEILKVQAEVENTERMIALQRAQHQVSVTRQQQQEKNKKTMTLEEEHDVDFGAHYYNLDLEEDDPFLWSSLT